MTAYARDSLIVHLQNFGRMQQHSTTTIMIPSRGLRWSGQSIGIGRRRLAALSARSVSICRQLGAKWKTDFYSFLLLVDLINPRGRLLYFRMVVARYVRK